MMRCEGADPDSRGGVLSESESRGRVVIGEDSAEAARSAQEPVRSIRMQLLLDRSCAASIPNVPNVSWVYHAISILAHDFLYLFHLAPHFLYITYHHTARISFLTTLSAITWQTSLVLLADMSDISSSNVVDNSGKRNMSSIQSLLTYDKLPQTSTGHWHYCQVRHRLQCETATQP